MSVDDYNNKLRQLIRDKIPITRIQAELETAEIDKLKLEERIEQIKQDHTAKIALVKKRHIEDIALVKSLTISALSEGAALHTKSQLLSALASAFLSVDEIKRRGDNANA